MIVAMLMLLHLCVHVSRENEKTITVTHRRLLGERYQLCGVATSSCSTV